MTVKGRNLRLVNALSFALPYDPKDLEFVGVEVKNMKKMEKQRTKEGLPPQKITNQANQSTKNINTKIDKGSSNTNAEERARKVEESYQNARNAKPGSITAKANMVRDFDERNKKK